MKKRAEEEKKGEKQFSHIEEFLYYMTGFKLPQNRVI